MKIHFKIIYCRDMKKTYSWMIEKRLQKVLLLPKNSKHILYLTFYFWFDITVNIICAVGVYNIFKLSYLHEKSFYFFRYVVETVLYESFSYYAV